jgi:uncharacterized OsmC-like protein
MAMRQKQGWVREYRINNGRKGASAMSIVAYTSKIKIEHLAVPNNRAFLPSETEPVLFGVHDEIADHYKIVAETGKPRAATLDYVVASAGGCLTGTFGGALAVRGVMSDAHGLTADVSGEIEREDDNVLVIKRIHVVYHLSTTGDVKDKVQRAYDVHAQKCPVYRSLTPGITITTELDWSEVPQ